MTTFRPNDVKARSTFKESDLLDVLALQPAVVKELVEYPYQRMLDSYYTTLANEGKV